MLTTDCKPHGKLDRAAQELMTNARRLVAAGFAAQAHEALMLLVEDGPWRLPAHGSVVQQLSRLLPIVSLLAGAACPPVADEPAMSVPQQAGWAQGQAHDLVRSLARLVRKQLQPAGTDWSPGFLHALPTLHRPGDDRPHAAFGRFCTDAEFVLKARISQRFGVSSAMVELPATKELEALGLPAEDLAQLLEQLRSEGRIELADAAAAIDTLDLMRAVTGYVHATGAAMGYAVQTVCFMAWLLLVDQGREDEACASAASWLAVDDEACARMVDAAVVPSVARHLRAGRLAGTLGIDEGGARRWLDALHQRPTPMAPPGPGEARSAQEPTPQPLETIIAGTPLAALQWLQVPVPDPGEHAWVAPVAVDERKPLWEAARQLVSRTGRWPVVTTLWTSADPSDSDVLAKSLFNRFPYGQGPSREDLSPRALMADARSIDLDGFLGELAEKEYPLPLDQQIEQWKQELAAAPEVIDRFDQALAATGGDKLRFERWLAEQEDANGLADPELGRQPEFTPDNAWLVLLPSARGEDALAYIHWFGMERGAAEGFIRLLAEWREQYGAQLFAHYGTMLEFTVSEPPTGLDKALALAREHELVAPCTLLLPGIALRHYALGLVNHDQWFLHERP